MNDYRDIGMRFGLSVVYGGEIVDDRRRFFLSATRSEDAPSRIDVADGTMVRPLKPEHPPAFLLRLMNLCRQARRFGTRRQRRRVGALVRKFRKKRGVRTRRKGAENHAQAD